MDSGWRIDKDDVLGTNCLRAVGELLARTSRLETRLREGANVLIRPDLPQRVSLAAQHLRDWGLNAEAEELTVRWNTFHSEWSRSTAEYDESMPNLLGRFNQWLCDRLRQWMISAGNTELLDDLGREARTANKSTANTVPAPTPGGDIGELQQFVNVSPDDWPLLLGWLVAAFRATGPYPVLALHGEQGSAKSTTARTLRSIIDPNAAPLRCEPREPRDLMIAANNGWVVALDNLSFVHVWLSDALCRLATGGGFATRALYENDEEIIFDSMRPAILTGIEELANRSDLLDRSLILHMPRIPDAKRRTEMEHWREYAKTRARILGAVLDAVSAAVCNLPTTHVNELPRMADFALWATAAESGFGLNPGEFLTAYRGNRDAANETALESSPVAKHILQVVEAGEWQGRPGELLEYIETRASEGEKRLNAWPKNARALSGILKRLAPNLRAAGVEIEFGHEGRGRQKRRNVAIRRSTDSCVPCAPSVPNPEKTASCGDSGDASGPSGDVTGTQTMGDVNPSGTTAGTQGDGGDAKLRPHSGWVRVRI